MPYGGRRRRAEWDHGGQWQWRQAGDGRRQWSSRRNFDVRRGEDLLHRYRSAGEELYSRAYGAQGVSATMTTSTDRPLPAACSAMNTMMPSSTQMMLMCDGVGWGPGCFVAPEAAPVLPSPVSPVSSEVQCVMENMLRLQHMGPEEAAKILKDIAALQGPYED
mmetsp:Transcript_39479/g.92462  ORF Transcript_39479/g.92462 Transcript_39479/m.92462 type:complete len:163 (+) Transcript_39479:80-568(+)